MNSTAVHLIVPSLVLLVGVVEDLRTRKVKNQIVIALALVSLVAVAFLRGTDGVLTGLIAASVALLLTLPLVLLKALGAGDMKLLAAFALGTHWSAVLSVVMYSLIWGAVLGLAQAALSGELRAVARGMIGILTRKPADPARLHKVPFTVALFFGWLSFLSLTGWTGGLL